MVFAMFIIIVSLIFFVGAIIVLCFMDRYDLACTIGCVGVILFSLAGYKTITEVELEMVELDKIVYLDRINETTRVIEREEILDAEYLNDEKILVQLNDGSAIVMSIHDAILVKSE